MYVSFAFLVFIFKNCSIVSCKIWGGGAGSDIRLQAAAGSRAAAVLACYALVSGTGMFVLYYTN